jgi:hypothetical protein
MAYCRIASDMLTFFVSRREIGAPAVAAGRFEARLLIQSGSSQFQSSSVWPLNKPKKAS